MTTVFLGHHRDTKQPIRLPLSSFDTHWHLIGGTGKGKTVTLLTMLHELTANRHNKACFIIIDRMGGFSFDLLRWFSSRWCPPEVRKRLIYVEGANERHFLGMNPLAYTTPADGYYKVGRATEIILRAWESSNIEAMPRLARWCFNAFWAAAQLGLNVADCVHFLLPSSELHRRLLACLPQQLQYEWREIMAARGN